MSDEQGKTASLHWEAGPIIDWLLSEGRFLDELDDLVSQLGARMLASGAPLWRLRLSMRTLHPLLAAISSVWERDEGSVTRIETPHGLEGRSGYIGSPLEIMGRTGTAFRKQLTTALSDADHNVLHDLKARGGTDYFGVPLRFSDGTSGSLVVTTDAAGGLSDPDIERVTEVAAVLAPIVEVFGLRRVSLAVAEAYLGSRTGRRVLEGKITRGDIERIDAAILVSDIRDWTGLNERLPAEEALALANRYFEIIVEAVESNGGEILKFIGDGVLAVFPTDEDALDGARACSSALAAARQALRLASEVTPALDLRFGMGVHFGEVLYGNIGSQSRIDFTVLGQAVNTAARIEGFCSRFERPILFSQEFADQLTEPTTLVAEEILKGHQTKSRVLTILDDAGPAG